MMDKDEIIRQLKRENESLKACIRELEAKLAMYENAHTPPSLKRNGNRKKDQNESGRKKPGQKKGHKGVTRPPAKPDRHVDVTKDRCPDCGTKAW
jgi:transposase